jgi:hypothetical protein
MIKTFTDHNALVTGILVTTPPWARLPCSTPAEEQWWCGTNPSHSGEYGVFAGYIAHHDNGLNGHGRMVNFVIHNEVNSPWAYYSSVVRAVVISARQTAGI